MEMKRFTGFDLSYDPEEYAENERIDEEDILKNKEYVDFLRKEGKSIKIRKIDNIDDGLIIVYYDIIQKSPEKEPDEYNRFADLDL